jgi:hypothetical protein
VHLFEVNVRALHVFVNVRALNAFVNVRALHAFGNVNESGSHECDREFESFSLCRVAFGKRCKR